MTPETSEYTTIRVLRTSARVLKWMNPGRTYAVTICDLISLLKVSDPSRELLDNAIEGQEARE